MRFPCLFDTGCQWNIISSDIVSSLRLRIIENESSISGIGDGSVRVLGHVFLDVSFGDFKHKRPLKFLVSDGFVGFGFVGLESQQAMGVVIDTGRSKILIQNHVIRFWRSKSDLCKCAAVESVDDGEKRVKVVIAIPTVLPPFANVITTGKLIFPEGVEKVKGQYLIDPVWLRTGYGLMAPRTVVHVGDSFEVPILVKNPVPDSLRLLRESKVGFADLTEVDETEAKDIGGVEPEPGSQEVDESAHPLDKIDLSHLTPERKKMAQEMLSRRHLSMARHDGDLGMTTWLEHKIELKPGHEEPAVEPQRTYPLHKREIIFETVKDLEDRMVVESTSSSWRTFPVLARKKNPITKDWEDCKRFCLDLRKLNEKTVKHSRLLPKVHEIVDAMAGAKYFTTIDLLGAYNQVPLAEECRDYTSFCIPSGRQYRYRVMTFGLCNAGQTFSNLMDMVLAEFNYSIALAYLDDLIIFSPTFEDHVKDVEAILKRLELAGLKARPVKSHFFQDSVELLGHIVSADGVRPDGKKVEAIKNWPKPDDPNDLLSFLQTANFYRRFIKGFSKIAHPLYRLTHNDVKWTWGAEQGRAFDAVKDALCSEPVMKMPEPGKLFVVDTDWSRKAIGWVISQYGDDGLLHPVAYGSKSLTKSESRYPSTKGEFYGMCEAVMSNRHYLEGADFIIRCDNRALSYLKNYQTKDLTFRTARMLEQLAGFGDFKVQFIPGKQNIPADALSRIKWKEMKFSELPTEPSVAVVAAPVAQFDWVKEQEEDDDLKVLKRWLTSGQKPDQQGVSALSPCLRSYWFSFAQFRLNDKGVVERVWTEVDGSGDKYLKVVPLSMRQRLLEGYHEQVGHPGITRMTMQLKEKYFWHKMRLDVTRHCETCQVCQVTKARVTKAPLVQHQLSYLSQRVFLDAKGPLMLTERGNAYYLILVDGWSKWVGCYPVPDIKAETVYSAIYNNWITQNGCMVQLHTDRGSSLIGQLAKEFCDMMSVVHSTTVSHHQMANGEAERYVKSTIQVLRGLIEEEDSVDWDLLCPKAAWALNVTPSTSTGQTPWLVKHSSGEEAIIPVSLVMEDLPEGVRVEQSVRGLRERQARLFKKVSEATGKSLRRQKQYYDRNVRGAELAPGDLVRYDNHIRNPSLDKSFQLAYLNKTFRVKELLSDVNVVIEDDAGKSSVVHYNQLKKIPSVRETQLGMNDAANDDVVATRRSQRQRRAPDRLADYDLSTGSTVG